jgi:hypothetical protein
MYLHAGIQEGTQQEETNDRVGSVVSVIAWKQPCELAQY